MKSLDKLKRGEKGIIIYFETSELPIKLIEMGCLPGNEVQLLQFAPFNDPMYLELDGTHLAIRKTLACKIFIDPII